MGPSEDQSDCSDAAIKHTIMPAGGVPDICFREGAGAAKMEGEPSYTRSHTGVSLTSQPSANTHAGREETVNSRSDSGSRPWGLADQASLRSMKESSMSLTKDALVSQLLSVVFLLQFVL